MQPPRSHIAVRLLPALLAMSLPGTAHSQAPLFSSHPATARPAMGAAFAYDDARACVVTFGGTTGGETWEWDGSGWARRLPAHSPSPRHGAAIAYYSPLGTVLFGGQRVGGSCSTETWRWDGSDWQQLFPAASPYPLTGGVMVHHRGNNPGLLHEGGLYEGFLRVNQTWRFDGATWSLVSAGHPEAIQYPLCYVPSTQSTYAVWSNVFSSWLVRWNGTSWTQAQPSSPLPPIGGSMVWDEQRTQLVHVGGGTLGVANDATRYGTFVAPDSIQLTTIGNNGNPPSPISYAGMAYDRARSTIVLQHPNGLYQLPSTSTTWRGSGAPITARTYFDATYSPWHGRTFLFGGWNGTTALNDTWSFDGVAWTNHGPSTGPGRIGAALCDFFGSPMMFGGGTFTGTYFDDLTFWNGSDWQPVALFPLGARPAARMCHDMVVDTNQQRIVMFGGSNGTSLGDTWTLNSSWVGPWWQQIATTGPQPPARNSHRMAYDQQRQRVVMFGGCNAWGGFLGDTWELDGNTWVQVFPAQSPSPRWQHTLDYDPVRGRIVLIGGYSQGTFKNDVWEYDGTTWTQRTPASTAPPAREGAGLTWDSARQRLVLVGGYSWSTSTLNDTWFYKGQ